MLEAPPEVEGSRATPASDASTGSYVSYDPRDLLARLGPPIGLTLCAVVLGVYKLGTPNLWLDEGTTWSVVSLHGHAFFAALHREGGNMLLYYLLLHLAVLLGLPTSEAGLRVLSVVPFVATVPIIYAIGWTLKNPFAGALGAVFFMANWNTIQQAQDARAYSFACMFTALSVLSLLRASTHTAPATGWRWAWVVSTVGLIYSHLLGTLVILSTAPLLALHPDRRRLWRIWWPPVAALCVLCLPAGIIALLRGSAQINWVPALSWTEISELVSYEAGSNDVITPWVVALAATWIVVAIAIVWWFVRKPTELGWRHVVIASWGITPLLLGIVISTFRPIIEPRYFFMSLPALALLGAIGLSHLARWLRLHHAGTAIAMVLSALLVVALWQTTWPTYGWSSEAWLAATQYVEGQSRPGDGIIFDIPQGRTLFEYYHDYSQGSGLGLPTPLVPTTPWGTLTYIYGAPIEVPASTVRSFAAGHRRVWIVLAHTSISTPNRLATYRFYDEIYRWYKQGPIIKFSGVWLLILDRLPARKADSSAGR